MPRRVRRTRELSSSPSGAERDVLLLSDDDDDDEAQGTADLTLHILAKAEQRGRDRARNGAGALSAALEFEDPVRSEGEISGEDTGAGAASQRFELDGQETPIRVYDASEPEANAVPVLSAKAKKKRKKKEKEKKERERKERKEKRKREVCIVRIELNRLIFRVVVKEACLAGIEGDFENPIF